MKAAVVVANEDVQYQEMEEPKVTKGTVKIRVRYSGICGSDIPRVLNHGVHFYPIVLGHEFSGDVVEVGEGVTKVKVGDRVSGAPLLPCMKCDDCQQGNFPLCKHYSFIGSRQQGSNADYVVVPEQNAVPLKAVFHMSREPCLSLQLLQSTVYSRMITTVASMSQFLAVVQLECLPCSGPRSLVPRKW